MSAVNTAQSVTVEIASIFNRCRWATREAAKMDPAGEKDGAWVWKLAAGFVAGCWFSHLVGRQRWIEYKDFPFGCLERQCRENEAATRFVVDNYRWHGVRRILEEMDRVLEGAGAAGYPENLVMDVIFIIRDFVPPPLERKIFTFIQLDSMRGEAAFPEVGKSEATASEASPPAFDPEQP